TNEIEAQVAAGQGGIYNVEPCLAHAGGSNWTWVMRSGGASLWLLFSKDDRATWTGWDRLGDSTVNPASTQPCLHTCQSGDLLLWQGIRPVGPNPSFDAGLRFGTVVSRSQDGGRRWRFGPTPVDLGVDGRCYMSS